MGFHILASKAVILIAGVALGRLSKSTRLRALATDFFEKGAHSDDEWSKHSPASKVGKSKKAKTTVKSKAPEEDTNA